MKPGIPRRRPNIHPYLPAELYRRFKSYCAALGATESSVVEAALKEYLSDSSDRKLLLRSTARLARGLERVQRDLAITTETLAAFIQSWLAHTPEIPESEKDAARRSSLRRFQLFQDFVAGRIAGGKRFIDDLAKEPLLSHEAPAKVANTDDESS